MKEMREQIRNYKRFAYFAAPKPKAQENEILIYGPITDFDFWGEGDVVTTKSIMDQLKSMEGAEEISVRINSPGGLAFEGIAIYNALVRHSARINITIDALAASAASIVAMAGDKISMSDNAAIMIHKAWSIVLGSADDLLHEAAILEKVDGNMANTYSARTKQSKEKIHEMMKAETWFNAEEAKENGFIDEVVKSKEQSKARADLSIYSNVPDWVKELYDMELPPQSSVKANKEEIPHYSSINLKRKLQIISLS